MWLLGSWAGLVGGLLTLVLVPLRVVIGGIGRMREVLGVLIFVGIGAFLVAASIWYGGIVIQWWRAGQGPPALGSVTVLGFNETMASATSDALSRMILAELQRLGERTNAAKRQLAQLERTRADVVVPADPRFEPVPIPAGLTTEVAIPENIAGVEIGWLLKWLKDALASTNVVDVTAVFSNEAGKASVFGHAKGENSYAFVIDTETGGPDMLARSVAAAIIQHEQRRGELAVEPLSYADYLPVVEALSAYATFERVTRSWTGSSNAPDYSDEYRRRFEKLAPIAALHTDWAELQWLSSEVAERAGELQQARQFALNEQRLTPRDDSRYPRIAARLERLPTASTQAPAEPDEVAERQAADAVAPILRFIGIPEQRPPHARVRLGVVGPAPRKELLRSASLEILDPTRQPAETDPALVDYTTYLVQMARLGAPDAIYQFAPLRSREGMSNMSELAESLRVVRTPPPDVLLFAYAPANAVLLELLQDLASSTVVVVAAGNERGSPGDTVDQPHLSSFAPIQDVALVVGATDLRGSRAPFSQSAERAVWAVGVNVPLISADTGEPTRQSGTSYSAALVAGAAALLHSAYPDAPPISIVNALQETAYPRTAAGPKVIDVQRALEWLHAHAVSSVGDEG